MNIPQYYIDSVKSRSIYRFLGGVITRIPNYLQAALKRNIARMRGATIGDNSLLSWKLALNANKNLIVGANSIIDTDKIDLRGSKVIINDNVIINKKCEIIRVSHYIDDNHSYTTRQFDDLIIDSYSWVATGSVILPQVSLLDKGTVTGAFSVLTKNTQENGIYAGNPAKFKRLHNTKFDQLVTCSLQGCDLMFYIKARLQ